MMKKKRSAMDIFKEQAITESDECFEEEPYPEEPQIQTQEQIEAPNKTISQQDINGLLDSVSGKTSMIPQEKKREKKKSRNIPISDIKTSEELQLEKEPIKVRITGKWFWRRVIIPPNAYVVHTRINKKQPVTIGMGISFRYKPKTDAYLVVQGAMQTIGVVANCISKEKQGINVLAYVQWQIDDFSIAYKKLDLSDSRDPLGIVNAQLREQAEAAIKDKIATMSVEEVLTDKAPIIEELTSRLKKVAEGQSQGGTNEGLGIKISTVQIREALVSSTSLWENLQKPYRYEQKKQADISYLNMQNEIKSKEMETRMELETREAETNLEIQEIKQKKQTEAMDIKLNQETIRYKKEQETIQNKLSMEEQTLLSQKETNDRILAKDHEFTMKQLELNRILSEKESELKLLKQQQFDQLEKLKVEANINRDGTLKESQLKYEENKNKVKLVYEEGLAKIDKIRQEINNLMNNNVIFSQLVKELPQIAAKMPQIKELKVFQTDQTDPVLNSLLSFIQKIMSLTESMGIDFPKKKEVKQEKKEK